MVLLVLMLLADENPHNSSKTPSIECLAPVSVVENKIKTGRDFFFHYVCVCNVEDAVQYLFIGSEFHCLGRRSVHF